MNLCGISVCSGYSDFISWTLPFNKSQFDRFIVVTSSNDLATQKVCAANHVECLITDEMFSDGAPFNKGKAINAGLKKLNFQDWCVHLDADIILPARTREILELIPLQESKLYSVDRMMINSFEEWLNHVSSPNLQHADWRTHLDAFELGYRLWFPGQRWRGFLPLGYYQMFNRKYKLFDNGPGAYPENFDTAADSDILFAENWNREDRVLIPEFCVYHLDSQGKEIGKNWQGRRTPLFGPSKKDIL